MSKELKIGKIGRNFADFSVIGWTGKEKAMEKSFENFSAKNRRFFGKNPLFSRFFDVWSARAEGRVWRRLSRRFFGDKMKKSPIYRRFIGKISALFLAFRSVPGFDPTVQISFAFFE